MPRKTATMVAPERALLANGAPDALSQAQLHGVADPAEHDAQQDES